MIQNKLDSREFHFGFRGKRFGGERKQDCTEKLLNQNCGLTSLPLSP